MTENTKVAAKFQREEEVLDFFPLTGYYALPSLHAGEGFLFTGPMKHVSFPFGDRSLPSTGERQVVLYCRAERVTAAPPAPSPWSR
jgi:hypothetical protein